MTWQPIPEDVDTTKPPFGRAAVLVGHRAEQWVCEASYYSDGGMHDGWYEANEHWTDYGVEPIFPTDWMPMPAPPLHDQQQVRTDAKP